MRRGYEGLLESNYIKVLTWVGAKFLLTGVLGGHFTGFTDPWVNKNNVIFCRDIAFFHEVTLRGFLSFSIIAATKLLAMNLTVETLKYQSRRSISRLVKISSGNSG
jgi:hypothetical protein